MGKRDISVGDGRGVQRRSWWTTCERTRERCFAVATQVTLAPTHNLIYRRPVCDGGVLDGAQGQWKSRCKQHYKASAKFRIHGYRHVAKPHPSPSDPLLLCLSVLHCVYPFLCHLLAIGWDQRWREAIHLQTIELQPPRTENCRPFGPFSARGFTFTAFVFLWAYQVTRSPLWKVHC